MPNKFFFLVCLGLLEKYIYGAYGVTSDILLITLWSPLYRLFGTLMIEFNSNG